MLTWQRWPYDEDLIPSMAYPKHLALPSLWLLRSGSLDDRSRWPSGSPAWLLRCPVHPSLRHQEQTVAQALDPSL